jgi:hypothetical protein
MPELPLRLVEHEKDDVLIDRDDRRPDGENYESPQHEEVSGTNRAVSLPDGPVRTDIGERIDEPLQAQPGCRPSPRVLTDAPIEPPHEDGDRDGREEVEQQHGWRAEAKKDLPASLSCENHP